MVHLVWIGGTGVLQSILSSLILKVYHAFAFKPITIKFGKFTNFWMLFQMTGSIFNSIDIEYLYQEKICSYPVPCSFRTWPIMRPNVLLKYGPILRYNGSYSRWVESRIFGKTSPQNLTEAAASAIQNQNLQKFFLYQ